MTQIGRTEPAEHGGARPDPVQASGDTLVGRTGTSAPGRVLVPTAPDPGHCVVGASWRPSGTFLAQLIATALQAPQTRARRRAEPADASAAYAVAGLGRSATGQVLRRSL